MARFEILDTPLSGLKVIQRKPIGDSRGYFERFFCQKELQDVLAGSSIAQINHSQTVKAGTVRGMHFQYSPHAEKKFVSCVKGEVFDVAVDIRRNSPTFLQWHAQILSAHNHKTLAIPEGFAHGFQSLTEESEILYLCTAAYAPESESGLNPDDMAIKIGWPLEIVEISERDKTRPFLDESFRGLIV